MQCLGHFGLGLKEYLHFTSPIRRYPDLVVHRMLRKYVFAHDQDASAMKRDSDWIAQAAEHASVRERCAQEAERDVDDMKKAQYIEQYFDTYPKVKEFIDKLVADAKNKGYTETMFGRRRPIPELSSSNFMQRSFGERVAMNAPIQGTAADIIKIAMIKVWKALKEEGLKSRLILQVHDELLIETALEEEARVREILTENMKSAADLAVTLEIDLHTGKDWYEAK